MSYQPCVDISSNDTLSERLQGQFFLHEGKDIN